MFYIPKVLLYLRSSLPFGNTRWKSSTCPEFGYVSEALQRLFPHAQFFLWDAASVWEGKSHQGLPLRPRRKCRWNNIDTRVGSWIIYLNKNKKPWYLAITSSSCISVFLFILADCLGNVAQELRQQLKGFSHGQSPITQTGEKILLCNSCRRPSHNGHGDLNFDFQIQYREAR